MRSVVALLVFVVVFLYLGVEILRWKLKPEQRRLRMIRKIGRR